MKRDCLQLQMGVDNAYFQAVMVSRVLLLLDLTVSTELRYLQYKMRALAKKHADRAKSFKDQDPQRVAAYIDAASVALWRRAEY